MHVGRCDDGGGSESEIFTGIESAVDCGKAKARNTPKKPQKLHSPPSR